jgi:hypothetical protein
LTGALTMCAPGSSEAFAKRAMANHMMLEY